MGAGIGAALIGAGASLAGGLFNIGRGRKQYHRQKKLMNLQSELQQQLNEQQLAHQMQLNEQGQQLQLDTWEKTNAEAQRKQLEKAGMSVGLMYGGSGPGGTTGGQGGGSAAGGSAAGGSAGMPPIMDIGVQQAIKTIAELQAIKAQTRVTNAKAKEQELKNEVYESHGKEADTYEAANRATRAEQEALQLYNDLSRYGSQHAMQNDSNYMRMLENEQVIKDVERRIKETTEEDEKNKVRYELVNAKMDAEVKNQGINLSREQERKIWHDIWQGWTKAGFQGLDTIVKGLLQRVKINMPKK